MRLSVKVNDENLNAEVLKSYPEGDEPYSKPFYVSQDHYFMMGDNRDNSLDSRYWGGVPRNYLLGKVLIISWSFETPKNLYFRTTGMDRFIRVMDRLINFRSRTRWDRVLKVVE